MADWEDQQQHSRRFAHRSQGRKGGRGGGRNGDKDVFRPRNMLGRYAVRHQQFSASDGAPKDSWLEVHELAESETGFVATFDLEGVAGIMLIAGSRKALRALVQDRRKEATDEDDSTDFSDDASEQGEDDSDEDSTTASQGDSTLDFARPPELDRPAHAFEKNTFRQPKWFAQWRGQVTKQALRYAIVNSHRKAMPDEQIQKDAPWHTIDEDNKAHLEFTTGSCREFHATLSCPYLGLKNVKLHGWKESSKTTPLELHWNDYDTPVPSGDENPQTSE